MEWKEVEEILADFKVQAERVGEAGPYGADKQLGRMLDYINATPLLKDYIESCRLDIPEAEFDEHLRKVVKHMGPIPLDFGSTPESEVARLWRVFKLLRDNVGAILQLGYGLSFVNNGHVMIQTFGEKLVLRFYEDVAMHFRHHRKEYEQTELPTGHTLNSTKKTYAHDLFLSHANANKSEFVDALYNELTRLDIDIWYDSRTTSLDWGDSLKRNITHGLETCRFGIVVLSPEFFDRKWPERELTDLLTRQNESGEKVVLPLLYRVPVDEMIARYPVLEDVKARPVKDGEDPRDIVIDFARILIKALKAEAQA